MDIFNKLRVKTELCHFFRYGFWHKPTGISQLWDPFKNRTKSRSRWKILLFNQIK